ncbi:PRR29 protein, partial [Penelope pileata]|nr:PRR29 protein [Penelope pileata]
MELGAAGDPDGLWGDAAGRTYGIPYGLPPVPCPRGAVPVSPQPVTILQQLPRTTAHPAGPPHPWGDLIELMMIQNSQMHQAVMSSLAVSALVSFGFRPSPATAQTPAVPLEPGEEEEEEAMVFHHHYVPYPGSAPILAWPLSAQVPGSAAVRHLGTAAGDGEVAVPPPPPPSATGTVGANVPPSSGNALSPPLQRE